MITREEILKHPDGTWILTNRAATEILATEPGDLANPRIKGDIREGLWWRRKQLLDHFQHQPFKGMRA